jgi:hypothetical protein
MKTKISSLVIVLFFVIGCGSSDQKQAESPNVANTLPAVKFSLKASNMMYVAIQADSTLKANQADPTKAEVFEKVEMDNSKCALLGSNGKYVIDNRNKGDTVFVNSNNKWEWETFEIIMLDPTRANIRTSTGKFVSSDPGFDGILTAKTVNASDWETFTLEMK